jgi:SAM-dependent methyltransferase
MESTESIVDRTHLAYRGQAAYTSRMLHAYDLLVFGFNLPVLWRCKVDRLLEHYGSHVSGRHLDVGVGTGCLLDRCRFPVPDPEITLMDLNPTPLAHAADRLQRYRPRTHQANVLAPWGLPDDSFDSIAMCNVLHCVPGSMGEKGVAFEHARAALAPGGQLFGTTVLGGGVEQTRLSRLALKRLNRRGIFDNLEDNLDQLDRALADAFDSREISIHGSMALFSAKVEG